MWQEHFFGVSFWWVFVEGAIQNNRFCGGDFAFSMVHPNVLFLISKSGEAKEETTISFLAIIVSTLHSFGRYSMVTFFFNDAWIALGDLSWGPAKPPPSMSTNNAITPGRQETVEVSCDVLPPSKLVIGPAERRDTAPN